MDVEPKKFFIGVIDFFSVLLPGALLTHVLIGDPAKKGLGDRYQDLTGTAGWLAFFFSSYVLGHFIFLLGAALLDGRLYDPIREATVGKQIERLAKGGAPSAAWLRFLARHIIKKDADEAQRRAIKIKDHYTRLLGPHSGLNAFQWCKARLVLENHAEAVESVLRLEADSKFFRSFAVVIFILIVFSGVKMEYLIALAGVPFLVLSLWRYVDQRLKSVNQAYWYVLALEAASPSGYRGPVNDQKPEPSRAGGVVYRRKRESPTDKQASVEYLIVEAKEAPGNWVLAKGHVEPEEDMTETAVREVLEETGTWARVERDLDTISFDMENERIKVQFYLMLATGRGMSLEKRAIEWLAIEEAIDRVTHDESRDLLRRADEALRRAD